MVHVFTQIKVGDNFFQGTGSVPPVLGSSGPWLMNEDGSFALDENGNKIPLEIGTFDP